MSEGNTPVTDGNDAPAALVPATAVPSLADEEKKIRNAMGRAIHEIGGALSIIRDRKLHREAGYARFEDYCLQAWGFKRSRADQYIKFHTVVQSLSTNVSKPGLPLPRSEAQTRPLLRLPDTDSRVVVWEDVLNTYGERATMVQVEEAVDYSLALAEDPARRDRPREEVVRAFREQTTHAESDGPATIGTVGPPDPVRDDPPPAWDLAAVTATVDVVYAARQALVADIAAYGTGKVSDLIGNLRLLADALEKGINSHERKAAAAQRQGGRR